MSRRPAPCESGWCCWSPPPGARYPRRVYTTCMQAPPFAFFVPERLRAAARLGRGRRRSLKAKHAPCVVIRHWFLRIKRGAARLRRRRRKRACTQGESCNNSGLHLQFGLYCCQLRGLAQSGPKSTGAPRCCLVHRGPARVKEMSLKTLLS